MRFAGFPHLAFNNLMGWQRPVCGDRTPRDRWGWGTGDDKGLGMAWVCFPSTGHWGSHTLMPIGSLEGRTGAWPMPTNHNRIPCPNIRVTLGSPTSTQLLAVWKKEREGKNSLARSSALNFVLCKEQEGGKSPPFPLVPPTREKAQNPACSRAAHPHERVSSTRQPRRRAGLVQAGSLPGLSPQSRSLPSVCIPLGIVSFCE